MNRLVQRLSDQKTLCTDIRRKQNSWRQTDGYSHMQGMQLGTW